MYIYVIYIIAFIYTLVNTLFKICSANSANKYNSNVTTDHNALTLVNTSASTAKLLILNIRI